MRTSWWSRWLNKSTARSARTKRPSRLQLERLESIIAPTVQLGPVSISSGPVPEGGTVTVSGTTTVIAPVGSAQLVIDWADGSPVQVVSVTEGKNLPFAISHVMRDDNPTATPFDNVTISVRLQDTGPRTLTQPDGGKYRAYDVPGLNINLFNALQLTGTNSGVQSAGLDGANDAVVQIPLPGAFRFYGQTFTGINVSENGVLSFNGQQKSGNNVALNSSSTIGLICPFWDDLRTDTSLADRVLYRPLDLDGDGVQDYIIIEWHEVPHVGNPTNQTITFQALLQLNTGLTNGDIIFNYVDTTFGTGSIDFGASATIGIQSGGTPQTGFTNLAAFKPDAFKNGQAVRLSVQSLTISQLAGPEGFGYTAFSMPFESRLDILSATVPPAPPNGNVQLIGGAGAFDDISANAAPLLGPFDTFNFYGKIFDSTSTISVSDNGLITFGGVNSSGNNTDLTVVPTQAAIAALWDDWQGVAGVSSVFGRVIDLDGDGLAEFLCVEWSQMENKGSPDNPATWQALLELNTDPLDPGDVYFNYRDTTVGASGFDAGASATVGIKDSGTQTGANARRFVVPRGNSGVNFADGHAVGIFQTFTPPRTVSIRVDNIPPVLAAGGDVTISEGGSVDRTIVFSDASSSLAGFGDSFIYTINYGDGTTPFMGSVAKGGRSFDFGHFYADDGDYQVRIDLIDDDTGQAATASFNVHVNNVNPTITFTAAEQLVKPGQRIDIDPIASFSDPGYTYPPAGTFETFTYSIDWGDGTIDVVNNFVGVPGGPGVPTTGSFGGGHLYLVPGTFTVTITVTDDDGGSAVTTFNVGIGSPHLTVYGADAGGGPLVIAYDTKINTTTPAFAFYAYDTGFRGGVRVASADVNRDGLADIITAAGPGGGPHVQIFDGATGNLFRSFFAYSPSFSGGVYIASADVDGDMVPDVITGAGPGGGPHVQVFSGATGAVIRSFFAYFPTFRGGVRVASGDVNGDGFADIITGAGPGGGPHVRVFSGKNGALLNEFFAYEATFTGGVNVAAGDLNGNGTVQIITGPGLGGGPLLKVFEGTTKHVIASFFAYPPGEPGPPPFQGDVLWNSGLYVGVTDLDSDGKYDIVVGPGAGRKSIVRLFNGRTFAQVNQYAVFDPVFLGGSFVGGN